MSKIYFKYGTMNSGKTQELIQNVYNYKQRGMNVIVLKPSFDTRETKESKIVSRLGTSCECNLIDSNDGEETIRVVKTLLNDKDVVHAVMIDEVQFLDLEVLCTIINTIEQHHQNAAIMCYGLRNSFNGDNFPSSVWLLANAEKLIEIKTMCWCNNKATHVLMLDKNNNVIREIENGGNIELGGDDKYRAVCRKHWILGIPD